MQQATLFQSTNDRGPIVHLIDAALELGAYEELWSGRLKSIATRQSSESLWPSPNGREHRKVDG
jgi:hypothetical protein